MPKSKYSCELKAEEEGYIASIDCQEVGISSLILGGGRETKESEIDLSVGIILKKKTGDKVNIGETLAEIHYNQEEKCMAACERLLKAYHISQDTKEKKPIVLGKI